MVHVLSVDLILQLSLHLVEVAVELEVQLPCANSRDLCGSVFVHILVFVLMDGVGKEYGK